MCLFNTCRSRYLSIHESIPLLHALCFFKYLAPPALEEPADFFRKVLREGGFRFGVRGAPHSVGDPLRLQNYVKISLNSEQNITECVWVLFALVTR